MGQITCTTFGPDGEPTGSATVEVDDTPDLIQQLAESVAAAVAIVGPGGLLTATVLGATLGGNADALAAAVAAMPPTDDALPVCQFVADAATAGAEATQETP